MVGEGGDGVTGDAAPVLLGGVVCVPVPLEPVSASLEHGDREGFHGLRVGVSELVEKPLDAVDECHVRSPRASAVTGEGEVGLGARLVDDAHRAPSSESSAITGRIQ